MGKKRRVNARPNKFGAKHGHLLRGKKGTNKTTTVSNSVMAAKIAGSATVTDTVPVVEETTETPITEDNSTNTVTTTPRTVAKTSKKVVAKKTRTTKAKVKTNQVD
jgi:hypothetical protein